MEEREGGGVGTDLGDILLCELQSLDSKRLVFSIKPVKVLLSDLPEGEVPGNALFLPLIFLAFANKSQHVFLCAGSLFLVRLHFTLGNKFDTGETFDVETLSNDQIALHVHSAHHDLVLELRGELLPHRRQELAVT